MDKTLKHSQGIPCYWIFEKTTMTVSLDILTLKISPTYFTLNFPIFSSVRGW